MSKLKWGHGYDVCYCVLISQAIDKCFNSSCSDLKEPFGREVDVTYIQCNCHSNTSIKAISICRIIFTITIIKIICNDLKDLTTNRLLVYEQTCSSTQPRHVHLSPFMPAKLTTILNPLDIGINCSNTTTGTHCAVLDVQSVLTGGKGAGGVEQSPCRLTEGRSSP